jgi:hypothetical protein
MSTHLQQTIRALEQDLEIKQNECIDIQSALVPLRRMAGLREDGSAAPRRNGVVKKIKAAKKNDRQTDRQSKARAIGEPSSASEPP